MAKAPMNHRKAALDGAPMVNLQCAPQRLSFHESFKGLEHFYHIVLSGPKSFRWSKFDEHHFTKLPPSNCIFQIRFAALQFDSTSARLTTMWIQLG